MDYFRFRVFSAEIMPSFYEKCKIYDKKIK